MRSAYLLKVDPAENRNVFFQMAEMPNGKIECKTGRVGATPFRKMFPVKLWNKVYDARIKEGFVDKTTIYTDMTDDDAKKKDMFDSIKDTDVRSFFRTIVSAAKEKVKKEYSVSMKSVTDSMIKDAEKILSLMEETDDVESFNRCLEKLFFTIPRQMYDVKMHLAPERSSKEDLLEIVKREREILFLASSESIGEKKAEGKSEDTDFFEIYGLDARRCTAEEEKNIKAHMDRHSAPRFKKAYRVVNNATEERFRKWCRRHGVEKKDIHFFYHGSKNFLIWPIMKMGLILNPNAPITGKMFGFGLYFANKAIKSVGYTSLTGSIWAKGSSKTGYLFVYKVAYKNAKHVQKWSHEMSGYTKKHIAPYDALFAHGGADLKNDEIIIYDEAQATIQYVIELEAA